MADFIVDQAPEEEMVWLYGGKCRKSNVIEGAYEAKLFSQKWEKTASGCSSRPRPFGMPQGSSSAPSKPCRTSLKEKDGNGCHGE